MSDAWRDETQLAGADAFAGASPERMTARHDEPAAPEGVAPFPEGELPCDVVVANILLRPLLALRDTILERVRPGGALAMSGVRVDQVDDVLGAYASSFELSLIHI